MSSSKRHFTAVIEKKEQGSYVSSSPSSAARKAVSKLCADDKNRKVEFYIRETTQGSDKKVYGMYIGYVEKLKKPIELKGRIIRYKPVAKLSKNKKMSGGNFNIYTYWYANDTKGHNYKKLLEKKFKGIYTEKNSNGSPHADAVSANFLEKAKKSLSRKFIITPIEKKNETK
jgi:hypothetical protein